MLPVQHTQLRNQTDLAASSLAKDLFANASGLERSCGAHPNGGSWPGSRVEAIAGHLGCSRMPRSS